MPYAYPNVTAPPYAHPKLSAEPGSPSLAPPTPCPAPTLEDPAILTPNATTHNLVAKEAPVLNFPPEPNQSKAPPAQANRRSTRQPVPRDLLKPSMRGKVYLLGGMSRLRGKERVPVMWEYPTKQRVTVPSIIKDRRRFYAGESPSFATTSDISGYKVLYDKYRAWLQNKCNERIAWSDVFKGMTRKVVHQLFVQMRQKRRKTKLLSANTIFEKPMPKPTLLPVFPTRPLNLNEDESSINYRKSHSGPNAVQ